MERTLAKFEDNVEHNMEMDKRYFEENTKLAHKGMLLGFIIIIISFAVMPIMANLGYPQISWGASGLGLVTVIGSFVTKQIKK